LLAVVFEADVELVKRHFDLSAPATSRGGLTAGTHRQAMVSANGARCRTKGHHEINRAHKNDDRSLIAQEVLEASPKGAAIANLIDCGNGSI